MADHERKTFFSGSSNWLELSDAFTPASKQGITGRLSNRSHLWRPPTDVYEIDEQLIVRIEIAGMRENDFSIMVKDKHLVVHGFRQDISEKRAYHQMEILFGEFGSEVDLPVPVIVELAKAEYRNGFLIITLPVEKPRHIHISSEESHGDE